MRRSLFIIPLVPGILLMGFLLFMLLLNPYLISAIFWQSTARSATEPRSESHAESRTESRSQPAPAPAEPGERFPYTIGNPVGGPSGPRRSDRPAYVEATPRFWMELASKLEANKAIMHSPAALFDFDGDGRQEAALFALAFYPTDDAIPQGRDWLLILDQSPPADRKPDAFEIIARREVRLATSAPQLRIAPVFADGSVALLLSESRSPTRLTDNWPFRYLPEEKRLDPLEFRGGSIGGRSSPEAISGRIEFYRRAETLMAEVSYGRGLALRSRYRWDGERFILDSEEIPRPAPWEAALIRSITDLTEHRLYALQLYGTREQGRILAYSEDGHYGYYALYSYRRPGGEGAAAQVSQLDRTRGDPQPFFSSHGIDPQGGKAFYYLQSAKSFIRSPESVLP